VPFTAALGFEVGKENVDLGVRSATGTTEVRGLVGMEGGAPPGLAVISFFSGLEVEGWLNEARGL